MTPRGTLGPKKMLISQIQSFEPNHPCFFIYILVVYEEYIIISSNFNIRQFSRAIWILGVIFCISQKLPLWSTARSHFYGTLVGSPERTCHIDTRSPNSTWKALALGQAQWADSKTGQSDTLVWLSTTSTTHCNIVKVWWHGIIHK